MRKPATELLPGDRILDEGTFPRSLYAGVVLRTEPTVLGSTHAVRVFLAGGGSYVREGDHPFVVAEAERKERA